MGGRGGYSGSFMYETKRREKSLQGQVDDLDSQIKAIDDVADAAGRKYADSEKAKSYGSWQDPAEA